MNHAFSRLTIVAAATVAAAPVLCTEVRAQSDLPRSPEMVAGYYVPPVGPDGVGAKLYPSPRPTPPVVGRTYITYEPLMPHEFLYGHSRVYWTQHDDAPPTRTTVRWSTWRQPVSRLLAPPKLDTTPKSRIF